MLSVVIPTLNAEARLAATLSALVPAAVEGLVREVVIVDGGSDDATLAIADAAGARLVRAERGRGVQLGCGAAAARFPWLLFLHADTVLEAGWEREAATFISRVDQGRYRRSAAAFRFAFDDEGLAPRVVEAAVAARCSLLRLPFGDQGLLISDTLYRKVGGYKPIPILEDVDLVRRLGRSRIAMLRSRAVTSAERYKRDGYARRVLRNQLCVMLYAFGVDPVRIARIYG